MKKEITDTQFKDLLKSGNPLPDNLSVGGSLDLEGISITALPDNLSVGGSLDLRGISITALPDNLSVGGSLYLRGTSITALPDNLSVGGCLDLRGTSITNVLYIEKIGDNNRPAYLFKNNGVTQISCGCFCGTKQQALKYIANKSNYADRELKSVFKEFNKTFKI